MIGVYIEPFRAEDAYQQTLDGIAIARENGVLKVWAACENGGVTGVDELHAIRGEVEVAGLVMGVYSGKGTWVGLFGNTTEFSDCELWFPAYWTDGHITTDLVAEGWAFGGWTKPAIHQYASTPELAGRNRDRNMVFEEDEMDPEDKRRLDAVYYTMYGGDRTVETDFLARQIGVAQSITSIQGALKRFADKLVGVDQNAIADALIAAGNELKAR